MFRVDAFTVRPARGDDAVGIAAAHSAAWRSGFTFLSVSFLDALSPDVVLPKWERDLANSDSSMFVAERDERIGGFLQLANTHSEVISLYVDPSVWRIGVGSMLLAFGEVALSDRGEESAMLWTARDSTQSRSFYERHEWLATGRSQSQNLAPGVDLHEIEYSKRLQ